MRAIGVMLAVAGLGLVACCGDEPEAGCGSDVLEQRTYILCTTGDDEGLVVALHGRGSSAQDMRAVTRLEVAARAEGLAVVYPDAREGGWDGEDIAFLDQLVAALDSGPVSVVGFSNGASMALRYAAARPDQVRAAVSVAGQLPVDPAAQPTGRVPLLEIYGTADPIRPYATGIPGQSLPTEETVAAFVAVAAGAEAGDPVETDAAPTDGTRLRTQRWTDAAGVVATLVTVIDGGHTWPSSHGQFAGGDAFGVVSQELDASADAIAFVVGP